MRPFRKRDLQDEVTKFLEVYNSAWERNWGFVPLTEKEVRHYAKQLKPVLDENWAMIAERKDTGEVVGAALTLPDFNQVLAKVKDGRLLPFGWLAALRNRKKVDQVRVFALGVKPEYQHTGRGGADVPDALRGGRAHAADRRRDGLDPRDQQGDEPRHGGHGRQGRAQVPRLRARAVRGERVALPRMAEQTDVEPVEVVDAEVVELEPRSSAQLVQATATQAALVAAGGFAVGAATVAAFKHHR